MKLTLALPLAASAAQANAYSLAELKKRFETGPVNWDERAAQASPAAADREVQSSK